MSGLRMFLFSLVIGTISLTGTQAGAAKLQSQTVEAWERYILLTEARIERELESGEGFLVQDFLPSDEARESKQTIYSGGIFVTKMVTRDRGGRRVPIPSGMVHHWMGSIFIPDVSLQDLLGWLQNYSQHEERFGEVEESRLLSRDGDNFEIFLRLKRKKVVTVHYNTEHLVEYRHHGPSKVSSRSAATRIAQLENPGEDREREKSIGNDSGFLWRLNSYWRFQRVEGGVIVECESVGLSRGIPAAFKWFVSPFVQSVPRESLESTLTSIREGSRHIAALATDDPPPPRTWVTGGFGAARPRTRNQN